MLMLVYFSLDAFIQSVNVFLRYPLWCLVLSFCKTLLLLLLHSAYLCPRHDKRLCKLPTDSQPCPHKWTHAPKAPSFDEYLRRNKGSDRGDHWTCIVSNAGTHLGVSYTSTLPNEILETPLGSFLLKLLFLTPVFSLPNFFHCRHKISTTQ